MPLYVSNLPELRDYHASRKDLLKIIDNKVKTEKKGVSTFLIDGMPGSGKTQLCIEYAHERLKEAQETNESLIIAFFNAGNAGTMQSSYEDLAMSLYVYKPGLLTRQLTDRVNEKLRQHRCLLIFDNVVKEEVIQPYLLPASISKIEGVILITTQESRSLNIVVDASSMLSVPSHIGVTEARVILNKITQLSDEEGIEAFSEHLEFHPLLLTLHAKRLANLKRQHPGEFNYGAYLREFLQSDPNSISDKLEQTINKKIVSPIIIAFEDILAKDKELQNLLLFAAFLSPDNIHPSLLHQYLLEDPIFNNSPACQPELLVRILNSELHPALLALGRFFNNDQNKPVLNSYSMHHLVQETIRMLFFKNYEKNIIQQTIDIFLKTLL